MQVAAVISIAGYEIRFASLEKKTMEGWFKSIGGLQECRMTSIEDFKTMIETF
jgi:hypothetical protein